MNARSNVYVNPLERAYVAIVYPEMVEQDLVYAYQG